MRWNEIVLSFPFRPTPSRQLSSVCLLELIPRPRAREERASGRFAAAGGMPICVLPAMSCRSLANARSLLLLYSSCGAVPSVSYRMICLDCLIGLVPRSPVFRLKRFNGLDVLPPSRLRYRGGFVPHHLAHHLGGRRRLLRLPMSSPLCRLIACVPSSSRAVVSSSNFPASLLAWLVGSALFVISLVISGNSACVPLLGSPLVPFSPGMSSPSCLITPRAALLVAINRPALLVGWLGAGRDGFASLAIACPPCRRCLSRVASRLRVFPRCGLLCLLACRRLCLYCDGEIVYMVCLAAII